MLVEMLPAALHLDDTVVPEPTTPEWFAAFFGVSPRIAEPDTPAPAGHRNNRVHFFDDLGLGVWEWHATGLVVAVSVLLAHPRKPLPFQPRGLFPGTLMANGGPITAETTPDTVPTGEWRFVWEPILATATADADGHALTLVMERVGRRGRERLVEVQYGYSDRALRGARR
jgi:hypothetical protein